MSKDKPEVEIIAEFLHKIWANWYAHQRDNSTAENILRWEMQSKTLYKDLTEEDKEKDRKLARELYKELFDVEKENEKDNLATDLKQIVRDSAKQIREIIDNWSKGV